MSFTRINYPLNKISSFDLESMIPKRYNTAEVYNFCDVQYGSKECDYELYEEFVKKFIPAKPNRFLIIGGDLCNNNMIGAKGSVYEDQYTPREQRDHVEKDLYPIRDRILFGVDGNHDRRARKINDTSLLEDICTYLEVPYFEDQTIAKIIFGEGSHGRRKRRNAYVFYVTHGSGGGKSTGTVVSSAEKKLLFVSPDIIFIGHHHDPILAKPLAIKEDLSNNRWTLKPISIVCGSSFQKWGGYGTREGYSPKLLGSMCVTLYRDHFEHVADI